MFMALIMLAPFAVLALLGGWLAAFAMLKRGKSPVRWVAWLAGTVAVSVLTLLAAGCVASPSCRLVPGALARPIVMLGYAALPLLPFVGGFLAGLLAAWAFWRLTGARGGQGTS